MLKPQHISFLLTIIRVVAAPVKKGEPVLQTLFWLASMTTPFSAENSPNGWVRRNNDAFPGLWRTMLKNDDILNDQELIGMHRTDMLEEARG